MTFIDMEMRTVNIQKVSACVLICGLLWKIICLKQLMVEMLYFFIMSALEDTEDEEDDDDDDHGGDWC